MGYTSIFCLTETMANCANCQELGLTLYDKQRAGRPEQDKGGGLIIGHLTDEKVKLEKKETESDDILVVEGEIHKEKIRISSLSVSFFSNFTFSSVRWPPC